MSGKNRGEGDDFRIDENESGGNELVVYRNRDLNQGNDSILVEPKLPKASQAVMKRAKEFTAKHKLNADGDYDKELEQFEAADPEVYKYLTDLKQYILDLDDYEEMKRKMGMNKSKAIDMVFGSVRKAVDKNIIESGKIIAGGIDGMIVEERKKASGE